MRLWSNESPGMMWTDKILMYGRLIKFTHTIFALPFALAAVLLANRHYPVSFRTLTLILVAMAAARSAAMGFNRIADYRYDRLNPRTAGRPHVTGQVSLPSALVFVFISAAVFIISAALLGRLCLIMSGPVLVVLFFYSFSKRFTLLSHLILGFGIGLAPAGAWIAITGQLDWRILLLSCALMSYIAGFDILYACQDIEFDRGHALYSMPACWGPAKALLFSAGLHVLTLIFLLSIYFAFDLGRIYLFFFGLISILVFIEHKLVRPDCLDRVNIAFFHVNSAVSILLFFGVLAGTWFI
jgi:4-hydroxybenzoate polyprenyltransferase